MTGATNGRREVLAAVLAEVRPAHWSPEHIAHVAEALDAALAAQEGERGGAEVADRDAGSWQCPTCELWSRADREQCYECLTFRPGCLLYDEDGITKADTIEALETCREQREDLLELVEVERERTAELAASFASLAGRFNVSAEKDATGHGSCYGRARDLIRAALADSAGALANVEAERWEEGHTQGVIDYMNRHDGDLPLEERLLRSVMLVDAWDENPYRADRIAGDQ